MFMRFVTLFHTLAESKRHVPFLLPTIGFRGLKLISVPCPLFPLP